MENDYAIITLRNKLEFSDTVKMACLPKVEENKELEMYVDKGQNSAISDTEHFLLSPVLTRIIVSKQLKLYNQIIFVGIMFE